VLRGLGEHSEVVEQIATEFELVPPSDDDHAELAHHLHRIARLLETGP
jgi:hypothetical protein